MPSSRNLNFQCINTMLNYGKVAYGKVSYLVGYRGRIYVAYFHVTFNTGTVRYSKIRQKPDQQAIGNELMKGN